jgi:hypothetical protein
MFRFFYISGSKKIPKRKQLKIDLSSLYEFERTSEFSTSSNNGHYIFKSKLIQTTTI